MKNAKRMAVIPLLAAAVCAAAPRARADWSGTVPSQALVAQAKALSKTPSAAPTPAPAAPQRAIACADGDMVRMSPEGAGALSGATLVLDGKGHPTAKYRFGSEIREQSFTDLWVAADGRILAGSVVVGRLDSSETPVLDGGYSLRVVLGGTIDAGTGADSAFVNACIWGPAPAK